MSYVPSHLIEYFENAGTTYRYPAGATLYMQGDSAPTIYFIRRGRVRMFYIGDSGKEITFQIVGERQLFGESAFLSHASRETSVLAVNEVEVISCKIANLIPYMQESRELNKLILTLLTVNYGNLCSQLKRLTLYDSTQRVASYLLDQTLVPHEELGIFDETLPYTHEELGACLNLNRVTVTRILNRFAKEGWVKLRQKRIKVLNRAELQALLELPR